MFAYCENDPVNQFDYDGYMNKIVDPHTGIKQTTYESTSDLIAYVAGQIALTIGNVSALYAGPLVLAGNPPVAIAAAAAFTCLGSTMNSGKGMAYSVNNVITAISIYSKKGVFYKIKKPVSGLLDYLIEPPHFISADPIIPTPKNSSSRAYCNYVQENYNSIDSWNRKLTIKEKLMGG